MDINRQPMRNIAEFILSTILAHYVQRPMLYVCMRKSAQRAFSSMIADAVMFCSISE